MDTVDDLNQYSTFSNSSFNYLINKDVLDPIKHLTVGELLDSRKPIPNYLGLYRYNQYHLDLIHLELMDLFDHCTKVLPIRVEFHLNSPLDTKDLHEIKYYYNRLLNNLRHNDTLGDWLYTIIGKYELDNQDNWHMHCVFLYDGNKRLDASHFYLAKNICQYWNTVITGNKGSSNSSNIEHSKEIRLGNRSTISSYSDLNNLLDRRVLGKSIRYYDYIARIKLFNYLAYLCKLPTKRLPINSRVITVNHVRVFALVKRIRKNESYILLSSKVEDILYSNTKKVFS